MPHPVVLLHGLGLTRRSMQPLERRLTSQGFQTLNLSYPSRRYTLEAIAAHVWEELQAHFGSQPPPLNFVTHSMGGIVVRVLARDFPAQFHRVVMIAPPNQGSEWPDVLPQNLLKLIMGEAALRLGTRSDSIPNQLGPVSFELGIIAGSRPDNPIAPFIFSGPNDGRVSVERTKVAGMHDHFVFPYGHLFLRYKTGVVEKIIYFLEKGIFHEK